MTNVGTRTTRAMELDRLIAEQERDSRSFRVFGLSLDSFPSGADLVYRYSRKTANDPRHGTLNCYTNLRCRCEKCRRAQADAKREWRRRQPKKKRQPDRVCCADCGSTNITRERVYAA